MPRISAFCRRFSSRLYLLFFCGCLVVLTKRHSAYYARMGADYLASELEANDDRQPIAETEQIIPEPPKCLWPPLDPWDQSIRRWMRHPPKVSCPLIQPDLAYLDMDGNLHLNPNDTWKGKIDCYVRSISGVLHPRQNEMVFGPGKKIASTGSSKVTDDQFELSCYRVNVTQERFKNEIYRQAFMQLLPKSSKKYIKSSETRLSLDIVVLDSVSWPQFIRHMPRTLEFMKKTMGFLIFEKAAKVADNTLGNMLAVLTGKKFIEPEHVKLDKIPSEFPTDRKLDADKDFPILWKDFEGKQRCLYSNNSLIRQKSHTKHTKAIPCSLFFACCNRRHKKIYI